MTPALLALYGDDSVELMGSIKQYLLPEDYWLLNNGQFSASQLNYVARKYPELMGFWAAIAKAASGIAQGIGKAVSAGISKKKDRESAERIAVAKNQAENQRLIFVESEKAKQKKNMMLIAAIGIPVVAIGAYFILK